MSQISTTQVDCPECKGAGSAAIFKHKPTGQRVGIACDHCGYEQTYEDTDTAGTDAPAPLHRVNTDTGTFPRHLGAGWFVLSNGSKVRGGDKARKAQEALGSTTSTSTSSASASKDTTTVTV